MPLMGKSRHQEDGELPWLESWGLEGEPHRSTLGPDSRLHNADLSKPVPLLSPGMPEPGGFRIIHCM